MKSGDKTWNREVPIQLMHEDTNTYLSSYFKYQFGHPIPGQLEVAASKSASKESQWTAQVKLNALFFLKKNIYLLLYRKVFILLLHQNNRNL